MHSRIFALSSNKGAAKYYDVPEYFVPTYADYTIEVDEQEEIDSSIEWLVDCLKSNGADLTLDGNVITFHNLDAYWEREYQKFQSALDRLKEISLEKFTKSCVSLYELKEIVYDEFGFWFMCENEYPQALQGFLHDIELDTPYYIERVFDYHF